MFNKADPIHRYGAHLRSLFFGTSVPISKRVTRLANNIATFMTTRTLMRIVVSLSGVIHSITLPDIIPNYRDEIANADESRRFELGNSMALLYFGIGYYLRVSRRNELMHNLQNETTAENLLAGITLTRADRKESLCCLLDALDVFERRFFSVYDDYFEHTRVQTLRQYLQIMDHQLHQLRYLEDA